MEGERGEMGSCGATLDHTANTADEPGRNVVLKRGQFCDRQSRIYLRLHVRVGLFPIVHGGVSVAHFPPATATTDLTSSYRARKSSRARLMRILAAERPIPR